MVKGELEEHQSKENAKPKSLEGRKRAFIIQGS